MHTGTVACRTKNRSQYLKQTLIIVKKYKLKIWNLTLVLINALP